MKRILVLATVAALMAAMLMVSASASFAHGLVCTGGWAPYGVPGHPADRDGDGVFCGKTNFNSGKTVYKDDHGYGGH